MLLMPKRTKYRKSQRGRGKLDGNAKGGSRVSFGDYGMKALDWAEITARQIEAARVALNRSLAKTGKIWIRIFPDKVLTKKPAETRMGKGKGAPEVWVAPVQPGRILFEIGGVNEMTAAKAMKLASSKLPIAVKIVSKEQ
ncbi:MAG TPA: 50S ribosomal protein L16 [Deltaproteobacteria bacterium]|nr:MAG: 50S ribosomal protein L16 [bacterium]HDH10234.1 50S ribosomal protein L16 [Deltaproteobacteria bacterium]